MARALQKYAAAGSNDKLDAAEEARERLTDLGLCDSLSEMASRLYGLEAAILGAGISDNRTSEGLIWIARDLAEAMEQLAESFDAERQLRFAEEHG